jgi:hypothetical protein
MVIRKVEQPAQFQFMVHCPACGCGHGLRVGQADEPNWTFNGDMEKPSFNPSLSVSGANNSVCHSMITDGMITYFGDSTHALAGKTVPLGDF